jgi:nucleoside-diphosphate-sugar epimerase
MRVFVTGATGFIGSAVVRELLGAGHQVLGPARSDEGAAVLAAAGAEVQRGDLSDLDSLKAGAARADGVIHLAFNHDFSTYAQNCEDDRRIVEALGSALAGSGRPLVITSGVTTGTGDASHTPGRLATEDDPPVSSSLLPRAASEEAAAAAAERGTHVAVMRLPQVHDTRRQGLVTPVIAAAMEKGVSAYVGDGRNRWPAVHISDVARLYRLALEAAEPFARYHAIAEEGVPLRAIAETIGQRLGLPVRSLAPEEAAGHFGWLAMFAGRDGAASSEQTQKRLGWRPTGPGLLADLEQLELAEA